MSFGKGSRPRRSPARAFTLAEMVTLIFIATLFIASVVGVLIPLLHAGGQAQAKLDTVQAAAQGFYQMQRDLRNSVPQSVYVCDNSASTTCARPNALAALTMSGTNSTQVLAIPTATTTGAGEIQVNAGGNPTWDGVVIYRITKTGLERAFGLSSTPMSNPPTKDQVADAVNHAVTNANGGTSSILAENVTSISTAMTGNVVSLQMLSTARENGSPNSTSYESDTIPRNPQ